MKILFGLNCLKIDLRPFKTEKDFEKLMLENNISDEKVCAKNLVNLKIRADFLFFETSEYKIVAYIPKGGSDIIMVDELKDQLTKMKSINYSKKEKNVKMTIDSILDKINYSGIKSLTTNEKLFLDKHSK